MLEQIERNEDSPFSIRFCLLAKVVLEFIRVYVSERTLARGVSVIHLLDLTITCGLGIGGE